MRVRCPKESCPIDVPDEYAGTKIRCPHCGHLFIIDAPPDDAAIQATAPPPKPRDAANLEHRIYDGLPPLSVMIALRRERGVIDPDDIRHLEMTDDDWKALAAFETLLRACVSLRASVILGGGAVVCNFFALAVDSESAGGVNRSYQTMVVVLSLALVLLGAVIQVGSKALAQARLGLLLDGLFWSAFAALFAVVAIAIVSVYHLPTYGPAALFVAAVCSIVAIALTEANVRVWWAMKQIEPPEISQRLADALRYLE